MSHIAQDAELSRIRSAYEHRVSSGWDKRYTIANPGNLLRTEETQQQMLQMLAKRFGPDLSRRRVLEVGCGSGYWLRQMIQWGARPANLFGVDLLADRIAVAKELCPAAVQLECRDASRLEFEACSFDLILQLTVFTSILDRTMKETIAREITRVLKPGGCLLWYDFFYNNPSNRDVRGISKREIRELFPECRLQLKRVTLAPPLGRVVGKFSPWAYRSLSGIKLFCTHYLGLIEKPSTTAAVN